MSYNQNMEDNVSMMVEEPSINMDYYRITSFLERHNKHDRIDEAIPLHQGFAELKNRISQKYSAQENSVLS